jgi:hypothetical protein
VVFTSLLTKTADLGMHSRGAVGRDHAGGPLPKAADCPAHVIVQRLTHNFPDDQMSQAVTNLGRIIKSQYILRSMTERDLSFHECVLHTNPRSRGRGAHPPILSSWG